MGYVDAFKAVSATFSEAVSISHPSLINQNGSYILFNGSKAVDGVQDELSFLLVIAANSFVGDNGLLGMIDEAQMRVRKSPFDMSITSATRAELGNNTLYSAALNIKIKINNKGEKL